MIGFWRDAAVVLLVLEAFILLLVPGIILFFSVRGMRWLKNKVGQGLALAQSYVERVRSTVQQYCWELISRLIWVYCQVAAARAFWRRLLHR